MPPGDRWTRRGWRRLAALALTALAGACGSDAVRPPTDPDPVARLEAPGPVMAAVVDLTGVGSVEVEGGRAFTRATPTGLRAIVVLYEPGRVELLLQPALVGGGAATMTASLVEVADGNGQVVANLESYGMVIDG